MPTPSVGERKCLMLSNELSAADVAAVTGGNGMFGNDGSFWIAILFLWAIMGNGWGNGGYGYGNCMGGEVQRGFDQQAVMNGIAGIGASMDANQAGLMNQMFAMQMAQQNCCCENRLGTADLKYTVAQEACADRTAVTEALRDVIANQTANTQAILDKMCQQEIDALKTQNANLQTQINLANLQASQTAQTARILSDNAAQTVALEQYLNPTPVPAYVVRNPYCCAQNYVCGCSNTAGGGTSTTAG